MGQVRPQPEYSARILLVEDDPQDVMLLQTTLRKEMKCRITVAFTQSVFVAELERELPDVIVSDSNVRAFDGVTALKIARDKCPQVPFILCSGNLTEAKRKEAMHLGATNCVSEEDSFAQLVRALKRLHPFGRM